MLFRNIGAGVVFVFFSSVVAAQAADYFLVYDPSSPPESGTGAFVSVCIDQVDGGEILRQFASDLRIGVGTNTTPTGAAEMLPFFSTPALVTSECLDQLKSEFQRFYNRDDLVVRELK